MLNEEDIKTEKDYKKYCKMLKDLVDKSLENAKKKGYVLAQGYWINDNYEEVMEEAIHNATDSSLPKKVKRQLEKSIRDHYESLDPTVCVVGSIGLYKKLPTSKIDGGPEEIAPLIRNGSSECVNDGVLCALSDGFEGEGPYVYDDSGNSLYRKYLTYANTLGEKVSKKAVKRADIDE
jgi:hypothetical protein